MSTLAHALHSPQLHRAWRVLWLCLAIVVCSFAFAPGERAPTLGLGDKVNHMAAFAALGFLAALALPAGWRETAIASAVGLALGIFIEVVQSFLPTRTAEVADVVGDAVGLAVGMALLWLLRKLWPVEKKFKTA
jgi:VanZ family protein